MAERSPLKRATAGGLAGLFSALALAMAAPPSVIQEAFLTFFHLTISADLASFLENIFIGLLGWGAANWQKDQTDTQLAKTLVDTAVTQTAQNVASDAVEAKGS